jgi:hypothetical protein
VSRLTALIDPARAVVGSPDAVTAVAERMRPGNGANVLEYVRDLDRAFAIPILGVTTPLPWADYARLIAEAGC